MNRKNTHSRICKGATYGKKDAIIIQPANQSYRRNVERRRFGGRYDILILSLTHTLLSFRLEHSVMEKSHPFLYGLDLSASVEVTKNYAQDDLLIMSRSRKTRR